MTIIPGFYMPPFYDGIPGWVYKTSSSVESFSYFAIKNKKGDHILLSNAFFNPGNFPHRAQGYYEVTKKDKELKLLYEYLIKLYCNQWKYTKKGFYETQKYSILLWEQVTILYIPYKQLNKRKSTLIQGVVTLK